MTMPTLTERAHDDAVGDPPIPDRPQRRRFTADYKLAILAEYDRLSADGRQGRLVAPGGPVHLAHRGVAPGPGGRDRCIAAAGAAASRGRSRRLTRRRWPRRPGGRSGPRPSWPRPRWRWRSWEKRTRSWRCLPRARTPTRSRSTDRGDGDRTGTADRRPPGVRADRAGPGRRTTATPGARLHGPPAPRCSPAEQALRRRVRRAVGPVALAGVRGPGPRPGVGHPARRRHVPGVDLDHVPGSAQPRRGPRTAPPGHPSGPGPSRAGGPRTEPGVVVGHLQAQGTLQGRLLRPVRDHRHLQPLRGRLDGRPDRDRRAGQSVHRRRPSQPTASPPRC